MVEIENRGCFRLALIKRYLTYLSKKRKVFAVASAAAAALASLFRCLASGETMRRSGVKRDLDVAAARQRRERDLTHAIFPRCRPNCSGAFPECLMLY
jgi:hypothetical protein